MIDRASIVKNLQEDIMPDKEELKDLTLEEYRQKTGLTMNQLSLIIGCAQGSVYNWCHGSKPHPLMQEQIKKKTNGAVTKF